MGDRSLAAPNNSKPDPVRDALASVAVVSGKAGHGSGFAVTPNAIVTNYHVIRFERPENIRVSLPDNAQHAGREHKAVLLYEDPAHDLAVLGVECDVTPLRIASGFKHCKGERISTIGSPGDGAGHTLENLPADGRLGPVVTNAGVTQWVLSMAVNPGNSGGPVLNSEGEVIGVAVKKFMRTESQALAIPLEDLVSFLDKAAIRDNAPRALAQSLHRQRYCFSQLELVRETADVALSRGASVRKDQLSKGYSAEDVLASFNKVKRSVVESYAEDDAQRLADVGEQLSILKKDPHCDRDVYRLLAAMGQRVRQQLTFLRLSVPAESHLDVFAKTLIADNEMIDGCASEISKAIAQ
jgi:S1-C subfamily serine protease